MTEKKNNPSTSLMLTVVTGQPVQNAVMRGLGAYLKIETPVPVNTFDSIKGDGLLNKGDFSGVSTDKTPRTVTRHTWVQTRAAHWEPAGHDICDNWVEGHMAPAEGYNAHYEVFDGFDEKTVITTSKRADIRQEKGALFMAVETINEPALSAHYQKALREKPVQDILNRLLGAEKTRYLTAAFNEVRSLKPLSVDETLDTGKVKALQTAHARAVANVKDTVQSSGISGLIGKNETQALVKRACGLDPG